MSLEAGVRLALEALESVTDDGLTPEGVGLATIAVEDPQFHKFTDAETESYLTDLDLLASEDETDSDDSEAGSTNGDEADSEADDDSADDETDQ